MSDIEKPCSVLNIPARLHTAGRLKDPNFDEDEVVYRRFSVPGPKEAWSMAGNDPSVNIFKLNEDSYNRSKYCEEPEDVLFNVIPEDDGRHYTDAGILSLQIQKLKESESEFIITENGNKRRFTFSIEHDPLPCMYPHTNVNIMENGEIAPKRPTSLKFAFRLMLRDYLKIIKDYKL